MTTTYAKRRYSSPMAALEACWEDFLTDGRSSCSDALEFAREGLDHNLEQAAENGWAWPEGAEREDHEAALATVTADLEWQVREAEAEEAAEAAGTPRLRR